MLRRHVSLARIRIGCNEGELIWLPNIDFPSRMQDNTLLPLQQWWNPVCHCWIKNGGIMWPQDILIIWRAFRSKCSIKHFAQTLLDIHHLKRTTLYFTRFIIRSERKNNEAKGAQFKEQINATPLCFIIYLSFYTAFLLNFLLPFTFSSCFLVAWDYFYQKSCNFSHFHWKALEI